jgi:hypothetical protein
MNPHARSRGTRTVPPNGVARMVVFLFAATVLAAAVVALVRYHGVRSPLGIAALLAIELVAIGLAVAFHVTELAGNPRRAGRAKPLCIDVDYL